jgi:hypothetical protein
MAVPNWIDGVYDQALNEIAEATAVHICSAEPANHAGIAAVSLGSYTITAGAGNGDWTIANGDTSGRKLTLGAQSGNNATADGDADVLAFTDGTTMKGCIAGSGETVNNGSPFTIAATDVVEFRDPVNE